MSTASVNDRKSAEGATTVIDPQMLSVLKLAIGSHPMAADLGEEVIMDLAEEAILEGTFNDPKWLDLKLSELCGEPIDSADFEIKNEATESIVIKDSDIEVSSETKEQEKAAVKLPFDEIKRTSAAIVETQHDLDEIVKTHSEWIKNVLHPKNSVKGGRANLKGADLSKFKLEGVDLRGANLEDTILDGMDLTSVDFTTCS